MKIPIDECPAGPWLDAVIAEALGYKVWRECRQYSSKDGIALTLREDSRVKDRGFVLLYDPLLKSWQAQFVWGVSESALASGDTAALAITRVFCKVCGIEFVEVEEIMQ